MNLSVEGGVDKMVKCLDVVQKFDILRAQNRDYRLAGHTVEAEEGILFCFECSFP